MGPIQWKFECQSKKVNCRIFLQANYFSDKIFFTRFQQVTMQVGK